MDIDSIKISCAIIKVEKKDNNAQGILKNGPRFKVKGEDILTIFDFIKLTLEELQMDNYIIYISGYENVSLNSVWSKKDIVNALLMEKKANENVQQESVINGK